MSKNTRLVYSSDGSHTPACKTCKESPCQCEKMQSITPSEITLKIRLEKKARGGKLVTVVFDMPNNPEYFKKLAKKLKSHCGSGGTYKNKSIEIQGDHKEKIKDYLIKIGFKALLAGG